MRPGQYWGCDLGDAGKLLKDPSREGSAILAGPFKSRESWPPIEGEARWKPEYRGMTRHCYDVGECAILISYYFHRTADDAEGLTFLRYKGLQRGEIFVANSSELRAVQGLQRNDFKPTRPPPPLFRSSNSRPRAPRRSRQISPPPSQSTGRCGFAWSATVTGAHALTAR